MRDRLKTAFILTVLSAVGTMPVLAPPMRRAVPAEKWPAWLKEAVARPLPPDLKSADAVVLHQETIVEPLAAGGVKYKHRVAARILLPSGVSKYEIHRVYYDKGSPRPELRAWTISPEGKAVAPDAEEDFYDMAAVTEGVLFQNERYRGVEAPVPTPGSVVAFEDESVELFDRGAAAYWFGRVDQPVLFSRFILQVPQGWALDVVPFRAEGVDIAPEERLVTCIGRNLPAFKIEEHSPPPLAQLPRVWGRWFSPDGTRGFRDWESVGRFVDKIVAPAVSQDQAVRGLAQTLREKAGANLLDQLKTAFEFAARQVRYVAVDLGITGYIPHTPDEVVKQLYGDCKDKSALLQAIGRAWGLQVLPVYVRTKSQGPLDETVPSMASFNHAIAAVVLPEGVGGDLWSTVEVEGVGRVLFLDATARESQAWNLPEMDQGTTALLGIPGGARLVRLPIQPPHASIALRRLTAAMNDQANLVEGSLEETWTGSWGARQRDNLAIGTPEERRKATLEFLNRVFPGAVLGSYTVEGLETVETPVIEHTVFAGGSMGKRMPGLLIVEPGRLAGLLGPRSLTAPPRQQPLVLGSPEQEILDIAIRVPTGWGPEKLPAPQTLSTPEMTVRAEWSFEGGDLRYKREASLLVQTVSPERYAAFREDLLRLRRWDAGGIVFLQK